MSDEFRAITLNFALKSTIVPHSVTTDRFSRKLPEAHQNLCFP